MGSRYTKHLRDRHEIPSYLWDDDQKAADRAELDAEAERIRLEGRTLFERIEEAQDVANIKDILHRMAGHY